jgi:amidohydrolase
MLEQAQVLSDQIIEIRRDLHRHPELGFNEVRTSSIVAEFLRELKIEVTTGVGRTGVIGHIGQEAGPTIAIRADMDALPIAEKNDVSYRSLTPGIMHACGHDAHTAILLGVARLLQKSFQEDPWQGKVRLIFQPSEENVDENGISGAMAMKDDGVLDNVDALIALHVWSNKPAGFCYFQDGYSLAAVDSFKAWIRGAGGHGAYPHMSKDPLFMLAPVLNTIYAIPSRRVDPLRASVVSIGQIHAGTAPNVIPNEVFLEGTIRSYETDVRERLQQEVEQALKISEVMGGSYEFDLTCGYPSLFNDPTVNGWLRQVASDLLGSDAVRETEFGMGAEDFAYMTQEKKGAMFVLGAAKDDGIERHHHTDTFDINESVLPAGSAILAETARRYLLGKL